MRRTSRTVMVALLSALTVVSVSAAANANASPDFDAPFPCGQQWLGSTRPDHSPSSRSVDFNRNADERDLVVASAPGIVLAAKNLGDSSYGKYVTVDHRGGYSTVQAHLAKMFVVAGQTVDIGDPLGLVGDTGNSYGAHLHYEQRLNGSDEIAVFAGTPFAYNSYVTSSNCPSVPIVGDWNGDRRTDLGAFKRAAVSGRFREQMPSGKVSAFPYALSSDSPLVGDWNGDGRSDTGSWRAAGHMFRLRMPDGTTQTISFGKPRDVPVTGDWNGDKVTDVGVWHPTTARFALRSANGSVNRYKLGTTAGIPVTGDWNGDARWDVGVYRPATSKFSLRMPNGSVVKRTVGAAGDLPVTGDWNGDGTTDLGVWSPATATFSLRATGGHLKIVKFGTAR